MVKRLSERPAWLDEFRRRTLLIDVIDEAFDPSVDDKTVRNHLKEAAKDLGELFMGPGPTTPKGGAALRRRKRKR